MSQIHSYFYSLFVCSMKFMVAACKGMLCPRYADRCFGSFEFVLNSVYVQHSVIMSLIESRIT